jgi:hypothetical protein
VLKTERKTKGNKKAISKENVKNKEAKFRTGLLFLEKNNLNLLA